MGRRFVNIAPEKIWDHLEAAGFTRTQIGGEIAYERANHNRPDLVISVLTSAGADGKLRECGSDAIRIALLWRPADGSRERVVKKARRIHRTGSDGAILQRIIERARESYALANAMAKLSNCGDCGAPRYPSGRCAAWCWRKGERK